MGLGNSSLPREERWEENDRVFFFFSLVHNKLKSIKPSKENPYGQQQQQQQPIFCLILYVEFHDGVVKMSQTVINAFSVWQQVKRVIVELGKKKR